MKRSSRVFFSLLAFAASLQIVSAQSAAEGRTNETRISDTSYLPVSLRAVVDLNHDSGVDSGIVVTRFESGGKFFFEVLATKIVVLKGSQARASEERETVSRRIYDSSYLPLSLAQFSDANGDKFVDADISVTEVQTSTGSVYSAVKTPKLYDVKGVEVVARSR
jgi:hypothetical protein